jgi:hypothetical protein
LLLEPILIPAVKDVRDEIKTTESATLGKLVSVLLGLIEGADQVRRVAEALSDLNRLLNVVMKEDGTPADNRLQQVRHIEALLAQHLRESFPTISLELQVPQPELRDIFSTAQLVIDDGVRGNVESKGDGLKRSVIFALLRTFVVLSGKKGAIEGQGPEKAERAPYLFLFEEPELYLHPSAQRVLFDALRRLSDEHQVILTTHSPLFLAPGSTSTFIKLRKRRSAHATGAEKPYTQAHSLDLASDMSARDAFQLMCFENNAAGFFADTIVLVEGDSDAIFFRHAARVLVPNWEYLARGLEFVRINGKGNVKRFREFFSRFESRVYAILDRDVLVEGFELLQPSASLVELRTALLGELDLEIYRGGAEVTPNRDQVRQVVGRYTWAHRYARLKQLVRRIQAGGQLSTAEAEELDLLFEDEQSLQRRVALDASGVRLPTLEPLLQALAQEGVFVLGRGSVESYYPLGTQGQDKPSRALDACGRLTCRRDFAATCPTVRRGGQELLELEAILSAVIGSA